MPYNVIGRVLFPRQPAWKRKREAKTLVLAAGAAVLFAGVVAAFILLQNGRH